MLICPSLQEPRGTWALLPVIFRCGGEKRHPSQWKSNRNKGSLGSNFSFPAEQGWNLRIYEGKTHTGPTLQTLCCANTISGSQNVLLIRAVCLDSLWIVLQMLGKILICWCKVKSKKPLTFYEQLFSGKEISISDMSPSFNYFRVCPWVHDHMLSLS